MKTIVITSGKGGVGKTTLTANLAVNLAKHTKSVVMIDADIGLRNLDVVTGVENRIVYDLVDVVSGVCRARQALIKVDENVFLLPAAQTKVFGISERQMRHIVDELAPEFDFCLIDCPAGIGEGFATAVCSADAAIVVAVPEVASIKDADRTIGILRARGIAEISLIVNRTKKRLIRRGDMLSADDTMGLLGIPLIGVIPEDDAVLISSNAGAPLPSRSKCAKALCAPVRFLSEEVS